MLDNETQDQYLAGALILGGSPCTAMVFVYVHVLCCVVSHDVGGVCWLKEERHIH